MKSIVVAALLIATPALAETSVSPTSTAHVEVMAALGATMAAINNRDADGFVALQHPTMQIQIVATAPDGSTSLSIVPGKTFADGMRGSKAPIDERLVAPTVLVTNDFAHVWSFYTLDVGGKRMHCGIDSFGFIKTGGKWLLTNMAWTREPQGCPK